MAFFFTPPTIQETPAGGGPLLRRYGLHRGITVYIEANGTVGEVRYPSQTEEQSWSATFLGGHRTEVTEAQKAALEAAGYSVETV